MYKLTKNFDHKKLGFQVFLDYHLLSPGDRLKYEEKHETAKETLQYHSPPKLNKLRSQIMSRAELFSVKKTISSNIYPKKYVFLMESKMIIMSIRTKKSEHFV